MLVRRYTRTTALLATPARSLDSEIEAATSGGGWSTVGNTTPAAGALRITGAAGLVRAARIPRPAANQPLPLTVRIDVVAG